MTERVSATALEGQGIQRRKTPMVPKISMDRMIRARGESFCMAFHLFTLCDAGIIPERFDRGKPCAKRKSSLYYAKPKTEGGPAMDKTEVTALLRDVAEGKVTPEDAALKLKMQPIQEIGEYAKVDLHRGIRQGVPEVIYGAGKTKEQILGIAEAMRESGQETVLVTRISQEAADYVGAALPLSYNAQSKTGVIGPLPKPTGKGRVVVATGGTSDIPVAEEAAVTAEVLGNEVLRLYDVGVSGIHRLLSHMDAIMSARVIVAVAGMEGALPSVIGGLADCPVIAVPTSVGYGASLGGIAALLSMLNSCASGVSVVNIDNGFGAGYMASMINHLD